MLGRLLDQFNFHPMPLEVLAAVSAVPVAQAPAMVDTAIGELIQRHRCALTQVEKPGGPVDRSGVTGCRVAISHQRLHGALLPSQHPQDVPQGAALRVAAQAVVEPQPRQADDLLPFGPLEQPVQVGRADS